jgi:hypothetical protein
LADHCSCMGTHDQGGPDCCTLSNASVLVDKPTCSAQASAAAVA